MALNTTFYTHPDFKTPTFGVVDFGIASDGLYSTGYKMIAFEPGKILQAQELNEIQFRMNVHSTLTMQMFSNWLNALISSSDASPNSTGPGWEGATPLHPNVFSFKATTQYITLNVTEYSYFWFLCKANSNGLYFWIAVFPEEIEDTVIPTSAYPVGTYFGLILNTSGGGEYTGELVNCEDSGGIFGNYPLTVKNSSVCGSSRYFIKAIAFETRDVPIDNDFCAFAQKRADGIYYLNNVKIKEV